MDMRSAPTVRAHPHRVSFVAATGGVAREHSTLTSDVHMEAIAMVRTLARSEQQTRTRIADTLHDEVGQQLSMTLLRLRSLAEQQDDALRGELIGAVVALETISRQLRAMTFELVSPVLDQVGLVAAIESVRPLLGEAGNAPRLVVTSRGWVNLDRETTGTLFRIIRELLVNVRKHADASQVVVSVHGNARGVHIRVQDDGVGCASEPAIREPTPLGGYGLARCVALMRAFGGTLTMSAGRTGGTDVRLTLPHNGTRSTSGAIPHDGSAC